MDNLVETYKRQKELVVSVVDDLGHSYDIHRCKTDGELVFNTSASLRLHGGHQLVQPVVLTDVERKLIEMFKSPKDFMESVNA